MTGEFTMYGNHYYKLTLLLSKREERLQNLLNNAPCYCGQTRLSDIDAIISYYRDVQAYKAKKDKTFDNMMATERIILKIMRHFEIPPGTVLTGEIPNELEYEIWADENDAIYIIKTKNLAPEADKANIIVIKLVGKNMGEDDD